MSTQQKFMDLHAKAQRVARAYRRAESALLEILQAMDDSGGYRWLGCKSLFEYATRELKLSESVSYTMIAVARKGNEIPELISHLKERKITLTAARMITPVLNFENHAAMLQAAAVLPKRQLEKLIAKIDPKLAVPERVTYATEDRLELRMGISEELSAQLDRACELLSSKLQKKATYEETLEAMLELYLSKEDPLRKAARAASKPPSNVTQENPASTREIPAAIKHQVILRDNNQCTQRLHDGTRCPERKWLDIHHIVPLSQGGLTAIDNLTTVCRGHHRLLHWSEQPEIRPPLRPSPSRLPEPSAGP